MDAMTPYRTRAAFVAGLMASLVAAALAGCGGGEDGSDLAGSLPRQATPPAGPISYAYVQNVFTPPPPGAALPRSGSCGGVMSTTGASLTVAAGVVSFLPVVGPALGAIDNAAGSVLSLFGANAGSACLQNQINALSTQLNSQQAEIAQINQELGLVYAAFYQQASQTANDVAGISKYGMATLTTNVQGAYNSELAGLGLWVNGQAGGNLATLGTWSAGAQSPVGTTSMTNARAALTAINSTYAPDLAASFVATPCPSVMYPDPSAGPYQTVACYNNVSGNFPAGAATPAVVMTYQTYATALAKAITAVQKQTVPGNIVPLFDQYNTSIVSMFQQSAFALQLMYQMEYLANQANYWWSYNNFTTSQGNSNFNPTSVISNQLTLPSATNAGGVQYQFAGGGTYNAQAEAQAYNSAQQQLSLLYAAYLNQLYLTTLGFLYTDPLVQGQSWPGPTSTSIDGQTYTVTIDYASTVGASLGAYVPKAPYPYQNVPGWVAAKGNPTATPPVAAQAWTQTAVLYQFAGLQNAGACAAALASYIGQNGAQGSIAALTKANPGWCPSAYPSGPGVVVGGAGCGPLSSSGTSAFVPGSYYDGSTLIPWYVAANTGALMLGGNHGSSSQCTVTTANGTTTVTPSAVPQGMVGNVKFCGTNSPPAGTVPSWLWYAPGSGYVNNPAGLVAGIQYLNCGNWTQAPVGSTFSTFEASYAAQASVNIGSTENVLDGGSSDGFCDINAQAGCGSIIYGFPSYLVSIPSSQQAGSGAYNGIAGYGFDFLCESHACPSNNPAITLQHTWTSPQQSPGPGLVNYPAVLSLGIKVTVGNGNSGQFQQMNLVPPLQYAPLDSAASPFSSNIIGCRPAPNTGQWLATLNCYFVDGTGMSYSIQRSSSSSGSLLNGIATWTVSTLN